MKIKIKLIVVASLLLFLPTLALATNSLNNQKFALVKSDQTIDGNYFALAEQVEVAGTVNGDVIAAGGLVTISGSVAGDVIVAGGLVRIFGPVQGDIRVVAGEVRVDSIVGRNATIFAGTVELSKDAAIGEGLLIFAGTFDQRGTIAKNVRGAVGAANLNGKIGKDVWLKIVEPEQFIIHENAWIGGDLNYNSPTMAKILSGATLFGELNYQPFLKASTDWTSFFFTKFIWLISLILLGLIALWLIPKRVEKGIELLSDSFWQPLGWGLLLLFVTPVVILILAITIIGLPLALVLLALYLLSILAAIIIVSTCLGEWLLKKLMRRHLRGVSLRWSMILGLLLFVILCSLPFIGWLLKVLLISAGLGAKLALDIKDVKRYR